MAQSVLVTGATGFVGGAILRRIIKEKKYPAVAALREISPSLVEDVETVRYSTLDATTSWKGCFADTRVVIHSAARVHVMSDTEKDPLFAFRRVNVEGTLNLARQAFLAGVSRFIFISSIKVNGEATIPPNAYEADGLLSPSDPYGISKMEAEIALRELAAEMGREVVIIRPVLVYGPGVKANFLNMMRWLDKGVPLPFGAIHNRRSLVSIDNLVDLVLTCVDHPAAANQTFLVSDGEDLSTTMLLTKMSQALNAPARLIPVPSWILQTGAGLLGKKALSQRLCGSLQVDISKTRSLLGWTPPVGVDEALKATALHFQEHQK